MKKLKSIINRIDWNVALTASCNDDFLLERAIRPNCGTYIK